MGSAPRARIATPFQLFCPCQEFVIGRLELLQTDDVRHGLLQPPQEIGKPPVDAINVVGRDPYRHCPTQPKVCPRRAVPSSASFAESRKTESGLVEVRFNDRR
jgi:hypothetical protein